MFEPVLKTRKLKDIARVTAVRVRLHYILRALNGWIPVIKAGTSCFFVADVHGYKWHITALAGYAAEKHACVNRL